MDEPEDLPFRVGQDAESKSFEKGFRGAWFRCKIKDISRRKGKIVCLLEFYDFSDEAEWTELYQVPSLGKRARLFTKHLMVRPQYPPMYNEDQVSDIKSFSEVSVVVEGSYKVGNLVDWREKDCYWTGRVTKVLDKEKVQIELPMPPAGEGSSYDAFCIDLRPSLDWSPKVGWTIPTLQGGTSTCARLIHPTKEDDATISNLRNPITDEGPRVGQTPAASPLNASTSSHEPPNSLPRIPGELKTRNQASLKPLNTAVSEDLPETSMELDVGESASGKASSSDSIPAPHVRDGGAETSGDAFTLFELPLNSMTCNTLEAAIMDLEELANKVKWIETILEMGTSELTRPAWRFIEHQTSSTSN